MLDIRCFWVMGFWVFIGFVRFFLFFVLWLMLIISLDIEIFRIRVLNICFFVEVVE